MMSVQKRSAMMLGIFDVVLASGCARLLDPVLLPDAQIEKITASIALLDSPGDPVLVHYFGSTPFLQQHGLDAGPAVQNAYPMPLVWRNYACHRTGPPSDH